MVKFKDIAQYYFGTGLRLKDGTTNIEIQGWVIDEMFNYPHLIDWKPLLRSLDSLTKPITVKGYNDGKEFVPLDELGELDYDAHSLNYYKNHTERLPFALIQLLLQWNFNVFGLEETEYIKID